MAKTTAKKPVKKAAAKPAKINAICSCPVHPASVAGLIFIFAILWILQEFNVLAWDIPWLPIIIGLVALDRLAVQKK